MHTCSQGTGSPVSPTVTNNAQLTTSAAHVVREIPADSTAVPAGPKAAPFLKCDGSMRVLKKAMDLLSTAMPDSQEAFAAKALAQVVGIPTVKPTSTGAELDAALAAEVKAVKVLERRSAAVVSAKDQLVTAEKRVEEAQEVVAEAQKLVATTRMQVFKSADHADLDAIQKDLTTIAEACQQGPPTVMAAVERLMQYVADRDGASCSVTSEEDEESAMASTPAAPAGCVRQADAAEEWQALPPFGRQKCWRKVCPGSTTSSRSRSPPGGGTQDRAGGKSSPVKA